VSIAAPVILRAPTIFVIARPQFSEPPHVPLQWVGDATDGERLAEFAGRLCTMSQQNAAERSTREYLENLTQQGQGGVLAHATYSLLMEGVSRALTHELMRIQAGFAFSELSLRYVDDVDARFVMPPAIIGDAALETAWTAQIVHAHECYGSLVEALMARYGWVNDKVSRRKLAREAARGVLPNSTESRLVVTGNARAWRSWLELDASETAEMEIRRLAVATLRLLQREAPAFFSDFETYVAADRHEAARVGFPQT
jgi:thymidylate synthase (FAD)